MQEKPFPTAVIVSVLVCLLGLMLLLFFLFPPGIYTHSDVDERFFLDRLAAIAGANALSCERQVVPLEGTPPNPCLLEAIRSGRPFHSTFQFRPYGNSEIVLVAVARAPDGTYWQAYFDPDRSGGYGAQPHPHLAVHSCPSLTVQPLIKFGQLCGPAR